jgi:hypothetical protein
MPAIWGVDLLLAVLLHELAGIRQLAWQRWAFAAVGCGLAAVLVASIGRQSKFAARADMLWQALEQVEASAPQGACIGWQASGSLNLEEGIHFAWHLANRGRRDLRVRLIDEDGDTPTRCELPACFDPPTLVITASPTPPVGSWRKAGESVVTFWAGKKRWACYLWKPSATAAGAGARRGTQAGG